MKVETAIELVNNQLVFRPGWKFTATDHTRRFEGSICVRVDYPAENTDRADARLGHPNRIETYATFPIVVTELDDIGLCHKIAEMLIEIETHEIREYLRVRPTFWAPFHPHNLDGMRRWANRPADVPIRSDLQFGIA